MPSVFFTDANGPCYHTAQDDYDVVDFYKLEAADRHGAGRDARAGQHLDPAEFVGNAPLANFDDARGLRGARQPRLRGPEPLLGRDQATFNRVRDATVKRVAEGRAAFNGDDVGPLLGDAAAMVSLLTDGSCDGFLVQSQQAAALRRALGQ